MAESKGRWVTVTLTASMFVEDRLKLVDDDVDDVFEDPAGNRWRPVLAFEHDEGGRGEKFTDVISESELAAVGIGDFDYVYTCVEEEEE
jgi:hypothetical protein